MECRIGGAFICGSGQRRHAGSAAGGAAERESLVSASCAKTAGCDCTGGGTSAGAGRDVNVNISVRANVGTSYLARPGRPGGRAATRGAVARGRSARCAGSATPGKS